MPAPIDFSDCAGNELDYEDLSFMWNELEIMDSQHWTRCEGCDERMLVFDLDAHIADCDEYDRRRYAREECDRYLAERRERIWIEEVLDSPSELSQYRAQNALIIPDRTPACIWQPGMIIDMTGYLPGDADDQRRPWMVLAVDWPYECVLACPLFTHQQTGLAHVRRDRRYMYMPLAFTSHTLQFVRTNQFRRVKRQWGYDLPWPDHDPTGFSRYHPAVVEHVYARSYLHATSMLAPRYAQVVPLQFVEMPLAVGRLAYHDFLRVLDHVWADTWWRPNAPAVPWL